MANQNDEEDDKLHVEEAIQQQNQMQNQSLDIMSQQNDQDGDEETKSVRFYIF